MKYAITADIHANLPALTAVLRDIEQQGCDRIVCAGDVVGYGFQPRECLKIVREKFFACVRGNHDEYAASDEYLSRFNESAARSLYWTREQLDQEERRWLSHLPLLQELDGFTLVHANLEAPQRWGYVFESIEATASLSHQKTPVCFHGHTHIPILFTADHDVQGSPYTKFEVVPRKKYFVNVGSVGQPRDHSSDAAYVIYDLKQQTIELRRIPFPRPSV